MAPLAANRGAVIADEQLLDVAREMCDALLGDDCEGGLTRSQLLSQISPDLRELANSRIEVFEALALLQTYTPKRHQQRYVLNMAGYIGLMVAERIGERGGVEELLSLLARTRQELEAGQISEQLVADRLLQARRTFIGFANELRRRRHTDTVRELAAFAREHDAASAMAEVVSLSDRVAEHFPVLSERAAALIRAAQGYTAQLEAVTGKLIEEGASARDFTFLDPADYDEAARDASLAALAEAGLSLIFDSGAVPVSGAQIDDALATYRPRSAVRRRPPQPPPSTEADPLARWEQRLRDERARVERDADLHLQGADQVELTDRLRATPWAGAARALARLLTIHQHAGSTFRVELADSLLIDADAEVTYFSPATLHRRRAVAVADESEEAEAPAEPSVITPARAQAEGQAA
jgi:hypothetical protein